MKAEDLKAAVEAALDPLEGWAKKCHAASLRVLDKVDLRAGRVARGMCDGVGGQHSWIVLGDPYNRSVPIIDPTLWSYDESVQGIWYGSAAEGRHRPFGSVGNIWSWGRPDYRGGPIVRLTPKEKLSRDAQTFLGLIEPLDREGWMTLMRAPVDGWPAAEIIAAMDDTEELRAIVPIDLLGMLTDRNPGNLYMKKEN